MKVTINRKITINGREYHSVEEMPDDVRRMFETMMKMNSSLLPSAVKDAFTAIEFNGQRYASADDMPADVRQLYDAGMASAAPGATAAGSDAELQPMMRTIAAGPGEDPGLQPMMSGTGSNAGRRGVSIRFALPVAILLVIAAACIVFVRIVAAR